MRISDWSSDVCSSDLCGRRAGGGGREGASRQDRAADAGERFFVRCARQGRHAERKAMIDREHELPVKRQGELLLLSRSGMYYRPRPVPPADLALRRRLAALLLEDPFAVTRLLPHLHVYADGV